MCQTYGMNVGIIRLPLQSIPPGKASIQHPIGNRPLETSLFQLPPTVVSCDVAFEVRNSLVLLDTTASDGGAPGDRRLADEQSSVFALGISRGEATSVRVRMSAPREVRLFLDSVKRAGGKDTARGNLDFEVVLRSFCFW